MRTHYFAQRYRKPAEDNGYEGAGGDRGDDFTPSADALQAPAAAALAAPATPAATAPAATAPTTPASTETAADPAATPAASTTDDTSQSDIRVPKTRLDAEIAKRRALEEQLARYEQQSAQQAEQANLSEMQAKVDELDAKYADLLMLGERDKALEVLRELRNTERAMNQAQLAQVQFQAQTQFTAQQVYNDTLSRVEQDFPMFSMASEAYNDALTKEVVEMYQGLVATGKPPHVALERAANAVAALNGISPASATATSASAAQTAAASRAASARGAVVDAVSRQAPSMAGAAASVPEAAKSVDISKMTPEQIAAARGDYV